MNKRIQKWGNSLAIRIPDTFVKEVHLKQGMDVDVSVNRGRIIIFPIKKSKTTLNDLLKDVNEDNLHTEWDTGDSVGNEGW